MKKFKLQQRNKIIFDLFLVLLLNSLVFIFLDNISLFREYAYLYEKIQFEQVMPLILMLLLSFFYFSMRRFFESRQLIKFAESLSSVDPVTKLYRRHKLESKLDIADILLNNMRKTNFCARWSGDEFLILCPVCEIAQAIILAEKLRADMYRTLQDGVELSVSFGVSQADSKNSVEGLLNQAEQALLKAKKKGKNCVSD